MADFIIKKQLVRWLESWIKNNNRNTPKKTGNKKFVEIALYNFEAISATTTLVLPRFGVDPKKNSLIISFEWHKILAIIVRNELESRFKRYNKDREVGLRCTIFISSSESPQVL